MAFIHARMCSKSFGSCIQIDTSEGKKMFKKFMVVPHVILNYYLYTYNI